MGYNTRQLKASPDPKAPAKPKDVIVDPKGQWKHPGKVTKIPSNNITMKGVPYPVLGIDNLGNQQMMQPGMEYMFPGASSVTEYPQLKGWLDTMQDGGSRNLRPTSDNTNVVIPNLPKKVLTKNEKQTAKDYKALEIAREADKAKEVSDRYARLAGSRKAQATQGFPTTRQEWADQTQATGDKGRVSNQPNFFDDNLNPLVMIGDMASALGSAPLRAQQQDSYLPYVTGVGAPLLAGALAGQGAKSTGQFVNNLVNPFAGKSNIDSEDVIEKAMMENINTAQQKGFPNPIALLDRLIPRLPAPGQYLGMEDSWNNYSPLNLIPGYGKNIATGDKTVGFRKFGNTLDDVIERKVLGPKGGNRMGAKQIATEGNWSEPGKTNEHYPGLFEATMNPNIEGSNIKLEKWNKRNGIVGTTKEGAVDIPLTDPGLSFNRRLPFSKKYVSIDKQKLIDNKFQLATQLPHVQSLIEKYGIVAGQALAFGYMYGGKDQALKNLENVNKYTVNPVKDWSKKQWAQLDSQLNIDTKSLTESTKDIPQQKRGGSVKGLSKFTSKNIKTSVNKLQMRNETLFGERGRKIYHPDAKGWLDKYK